MTAYSEITTLTGMTMPELETFLDEQLPADAYSPVPGGANLTDIDPNYMRDVLNSAFGLCGYGWGYTYQPETVITRAEVETTRSGSRDVVVATVGLLEFWYKLQEGNHISLNKVPATGSSKNSNDAYALKGALTNAIGNAVSNIGFQKSVYLGKRSHLTVRSKGDRSAAPTSTAATAPKPSPAAPSKNGSKPAGTGDRPAAPTTPANTAPADTGDAGNYVIPAGFKDTHVGKTLNELSDAALKWYAEKLAVTNDVTREMREQAQIAAKARNL